jgi:hypothetical protein
MPFNILGGKLFLALVLAFFVAQVIFRPVWRAAELALFLFGTMMACLHVRFLLLFVPFFAPLFAALLARWLPKYDRKKDHYVLNAVLMAIVIAAMVRYFPSRRNLERIVSGSYPLRAVAYLRQHAVPGPMYNTYGYGGYLIWALPESKVFIDGRGDLYEDGGAFSEYLEIAALKPAAFSVLKAHGIQSCLLERKEPLATVLSAHPDWRQEYSDDVSVLFVKRNATSPADTIRASVAVGEKE